MTTTSRSLARKYRLATGRKPSHTPGRTKADTCQKSPLKTFGMNARPHRMRGKGDLTRYETYCAHIDSMKGNEKSK